MPQPPGKPPLSPMERLLINMHREKPVPAGQGRVFENHVLVNETDLVKWSEDRMRRALAEVWRGRFGDLQAALGVSISRTSTRRPGSSA